MSGEERPHAAHTASSPAHAGSPSRPRKLAASSSSASSSSSSSSPAAALAILQTGLVIKREAWEIDPSEVELNKHSEVVGEGYFGIVYKARWRELTVCIKKLKNVRGGEAINFQKEVKIYSQLRHPHLVAFLAACTHPKHLCIITEWMSGGSLFEFIHQQKAINGILYQRNDYSTLLRICKEICMGMIYLASSHLVHRDLTTSNILLDGHCVAKVSDFGLSRPNADAAISGGGGGNLFYVAPESFLLQQYTEYSDVFAFGIIANELFSGVAPFAGVSPALAASECANRGARPSINPSTPVGIVRLIVACWAHDAAQRPTFRQILVALEDLIKDLCPASVSSSKGINDAGGNSNGISRNSGDEEKPERKKKSKLKGDATSASPSPPTSGSAAPVAPSTPSSNGKKSKHKGSAAVSPSAAHHHTSYDRPHTPDEMDDSNARYESEPGPYAETGDHETREANPVQKVPIISPDPNVTPKDVRLFLTCLKKLLPQVEAFSLHKPQLSNIDIYCDPTNNKPSSATSTSRTTSLTVVDQNTSTSATNPFRSKSEGDADNETNTNGNFSLEGKARQHNCSPNFQSSMYPRLAPAVGELVICRAKRCDDMGAQYELVEYTQPAIVGYSPMQELTRRKMRSISKLVTIGQLDVLRVLHIDVERGFVDLGRKDVADQVRSATLQYFQQAQAAHDIVLTAAKSLQVCSFCLYWHVVWPLANRYEGSVFKLLRVSLVSPTLVFSEFRECICLQKFHASILARSNESPADTNTAMQILTTPRVLPEIARRCEHQRVHLNLSRLSLDRFPSQLMEPVASVSVNASEEGVPSQFEQEGEAATPNSARKSGKGSRSSSTNASRRSSGNLAAMDKEGSAGGSGGKGERSDKEKGTLVSTLRSINIEENPLRVLPDRIGAFRKLQELNVNNCLLTDLPQQLSQCNNLQRLYAFGNEFTKIPNVIRSLLQLTQLNLSLNRIQSLEVGDLSGLSNLLELSLARNQLETLLPNSLPNSIQTIDLSHNKFVRFPIALFDCLTSLVSLELSSNQIDHVPAPNFVSTTPLQYVEWIDVSNNRITSIHPALFKGCSYLTWVNLHNNQLEKIPDSMFDLVRTPATSSSSVESESKSTSTSATTTAPAGLNFLNISKNRIHSSATSLPDWQKLKELIPQFIYDESSVPDGKSTPVAASSSPIPTQVSIAVSPASVASPTPAVAVVAPSPPRAMHLWSSEEVGKWLIRENLGEYAPEFIKQLITGSTLFDLDKSDLRELGVMALGTQKKILKLIQEAKDALQASLSAAATPSSSVQPSPALSGQSGELSGVANLSLGPSKSAEGAPPSVAVRRANSTLSPSSSLLSMNSQLNSVAASPPLSAASLSVGCDQRTCERIRSALLRSTLASPSLCRPILLRCIIVLLIGQVHEAEEARETLDAAVAAAKAASAAVGGAVSAPFQGMNVGTKSQLTLTPLLLPLYLLSLPCLLPTEGIALIESAIGEMNKSLVARGKGGRVKVCVRPYVVDIQTTVHANSAAALGTNDNQVSSGPSAAAGSGLMRTKSTSSSNISGFSGEILAALQAFQQCKKEEAEEKMKRREDQMKKKREKREGDELKKKKKKEKSAADDATSAEGKPSSIPAGAFD